MSMASFSSSVRVPPHPRGWSPAEPRRKGVGQGSPAPAGMVPHQPRPAPTAARFPRTRGDGPDMGVSHDYWPSVPPHPRGWSPLKEPHNGYERGSPAPAGMVPRASRAAWRPMRFPRTRGDGPEPLHPQRYAPAVPPHPRGWSQKRMAKGITIQGSPAPAGMVPKKRRHHGRRLGFPRTRGDGPRGDDPP